MAKRLQGTARIYNKVSIEESLDPAVCWNWLGGKRKSGRKFYGCLSVENKTYSAHRFSYEAFYGDIPENKIVMHICDNSLCVNPAHLKLGTNLDNMEDMRQKARQSKPSNLTFDQVSEIRQILKTSNIGRRELAKQYNVSHTTINGIANEIYRKIS